MGIQKVIEKFCVEDAVYWAPDGNDGYGQKTYADPVDIKVRWDGKVKVISGDNGKEIVSVAEILLAQDVQEEGVLLKGTVDDLTAEQQSDPFSITGAYEIKVVTKVPFVFSTSEFVRTAYL